MIKKAVYTYWDTEQRKSNAGFRNTEELAITLALSIEKIKEQFEEVELVTNTYGKVLLSKYNLPFTSIQVILDPLDNVLKDHFWAYPKLVAYSIQDKPFIHLDIDVILWQKINQEALEADLAFQNKEMITDHNYYEAMLNRALNTCAKINKEIATQKIDCAMNCGVVIVNNLEAVKLLKETAEEYVLAPENEAYWNSLNNVSMQNHLFEQYFFSCIIKKLELNAKTLLSDDFHASAIRDFKLTHLWGGVKRDPEIMERIKNRLFKDYPQYKETFSKSETVIEPQIFI